MDKKQIQTGNKLISEVLMGVNLSKDSLYINLDFHCSWEIIMAAVEKVEGISHLLDEDDKLPMCFRVQIQNDECTIYRASNLYGWSEIVSERIEGKKIESVWRAIIGFIKWMSRKK